MTNKEEFLKFFNYDEVALAESCYNEPNRIYHNWNHVLNIFKLYGSSVRRETLNMILYHDIIFDNLGDNEKRSAELYRECASLYDSKVFDTILATENHWALENYRLDYDQMLFLDYDIFEFGSHEIVFNNNGEKLYKEYLLMNNLSDDVNSRKEFNEKRMIFFDNVLSAPNIFKVIRSRNQKAKENIRKAMKEIEATL